MPKHPPYACGQKPEDRKDAATRKSCTTEDNARPESHRTRPRVIPSSTRGKALFPARPNDRRGVGNATAEKAVKVDRSTTESTNLSDMDNASNVFSLRKEIAEWKRETRRNADITGQKKAESEGIIGNRMRIDTYAEPSHTGPSREENPSETPTESADTGTARRQLATKQRQDKSGAPAVTWIDLQPDSSARTSLKSFTDYLTESQDQDEAPAFAASNRLRLSSETLNALDGAEKLVDHVENQLARMNFDDSFTDDSREDRYDGSKITDERLRLDKVVNTMFDKGYYVPAPRPVFDPDNVAPPKLHGARTSSVPIGESIEATPALDECPLCRTDAPASERRKAAKVPAAHAEGPIANEDKSDRLSVQRGPAVSIKGLLAVQTARIVDIQPVERVAPAKRLENIVTYECRHLENSASEEQPAERDSLGVQAKWARDRDRSGGNGGGPSTTTANEASRFWDADAEAQLDAIDLSLAEPSVLFEVDAVLRQQRDAVRRAREATAKLDRFLAERTPVDSANVFAEEVDDGAEDRPSESRRPPVQERPSGSVDEDSAGKSALDGARSLEPHSVVESSARTRTRSNVGFVKNPESSPNLKDNDSAIDARDRSKSSANFATPPLLEDLSANVGRERDDRSTASETARGALRADETDDEPLEETRTIVYEGVDAEGGSERDKSTDEPQEDLEVDSRKTSHLIDSISDASLRGSSERARDSQWSRETSSARVHHGGAEEPSTESKIEMRLSEARDTLQTLTKVIDAPDCGSPSVAHGEPRLDAGALEQRRAVHDLAEATKNVTLRSSDPRRESCRVVSGANRERHGSLTAMLRETGDAGQSSIDRRKLLCLQNLESCSIRSPVQAKRLFTSTIVGDTEPPTVFARSNDSSTIRQDSSSDSHSEGEIRLGSAASRSTGEIRRSALGGESSCSATGSTTTSGAALDKSSSASAGETSGLRGN